jgi:hypothetical protein
VLGFIGQKYQIMDDFFDSPWKFVTVQVGKKILLLIFIDSFPWVKEMLSNLPGFVTVLIA